MKTVGAMLAKLGAHPQVLGVIRYGTDHTEDGYSTGDVDLFVVLSGDELPAESLHFGVGSTPVDLNLITLKRLTALRPAFDFPGLALRDSDIVFDRTGEVSRALSRLQAGFSSLLPEVLSEHDVAFMRHGHRHGLDKLRGRLDSEPLLANVLLGANVHWLIQTYLRVRGLPFEGERRALEVLRAHDTELYALLEAFYRADSLRDKVQLTEMLTARALEPVGGAWQRGEVLAFSRSEDETGAEPLASRGLSVYRELFGEASA